MVAVIPAYLIGSDLFFRSQVDDSAARIGSSDRVLRLASAGFMRERRSLSLICSAKGEARLVLMAKLAEKAFLKIGETAPATFAFRSGTVTVASIDTPGSVVANGFVETVATPPLNASQLKQIGNGLPRASEVQVTAIGRGVTLGVDATARDTDDFIADCGVGIAAPEKQNVKKPGKQIKQPGEKRSFLREIAHAA